MTRQHSLKAGMIVKVYENPISRLNHEGNAKLIKRIRKDGKLSETWLVRFDGESGQYERVIHLPADIVQFCGEPSVK